MSKYQYLEIVRHFDSKVIKRVDVTGHSERSIDKVEGGMNRNLNHFDYCVEFVESDEKLEDVK